MLRLTGAIPKSWRSYTVRATSREFLMKDIRQYAISPGREWMHRCSSCEPGSNCSHSCYVTAAATRPASTGPSDIAPGFAGQTFDQPARQIVFQYYLEAVWTAQDRRDQLIGRISAMAAHWPMGPLVEALRGLRGLDFISSARFLAVGDLGRFENARAADVVSRPSAFGAVKRRTDLARPYHQDRQRRGTGECSSRPPGAIAIHRKLPRTRPRSSCGFPR